MTASSRPYPRFDNSDDDETATKDVQQGPLSTANSSCVQVAVRVRPLLALEAGTSRCLEVYQKTIQLGGSSGPLFTFDQVFDSHTQQETVFQSRVARLVESCLEGYNATILAYGQTGSGKTYTMMGGDDHESQFAGIIPRSLRLLFSRLEERAAQTDFQVRLQFLEIYGENIRDLLATQSAKLSIRDLGGDHEPEVVGAQQAPVVATLDALRCLSNGMLRRVTGATAMNASSSRSHAILSVIVEQQQQQKDDVRPVTKILSKFNFVDLAGSERIKRTQASGKRLKEGININKGLLVLGNVISALGDPKKRGKSFIPYRDSKLTRLLKGSLGGNHKTLVIACVSPSEDNLEESLNCLRYANRAKNIQNNAVVNVDANSRIISQLKQQVQSLASALLKSIDGHDVLSDGLLSKEDLQEMARGKADGNVRRPTVETTSETDAPSNTEDASRDEVDARVARLTDELRSTKQCRDEAEEHLFSTRAENELLRLQLSVTDPNESNTTPQHQAFLQKAAAYEKEISSLRKSLRTSDAAIETFGLTDYKSSFSVENAKRVAEEERHRLNLLTERLAREDSKRAIVDDDVSEGEMISESAKKFIASVDEDDDLITDKSRSQSNAMTEEELKVLQEGNDIRSHLIELSRGIAAKEELIDQLKFSQEKYANMRHFYEEKVKQMESALSERENERELLLRKLQQTNATDLTSVANLKDALKDKEDHIANLRKKHKQLTDLTAVSSRNQLEIDNLQNDVQEMKKRKVDLQKQLTQERKAHAETVKQLRKEAVQKDKELTRLQRISSKHETEAKRAQQMAKSRLGELSQLRTRYKDAEKRLRVISVKRGVMAKAGLDPVLVGRRSSKTAQRKATRQVDVDHLRGYLDTKVTEIARKEALADKLAHEWEEHFELLARKEEAKEETDEEDMQAVDLQIRFKEDRIRSLASKLGSGAEKTDEAEPKYSFETLFADKDFKHMTKGQNPEELMQVVAKVMVGMIVRERRRVAALARAASSLDEKLVSTEKELQASEAALQSYMDEQRQEAAASSMDRQENILSLMDMVREDTERSPSPAPVEHASQQTSRENTMLILANERIEVLQQHIEDLRTREITLDSYRDRSEELRGLLEAKTDEYSDLRNRLQKVKSRVDTLKSQLKERGIEDESIKSIINTLVGLTTSRRGSVVDLNHQHEEDMLELLSDSLDEKENPEWAADIMADLEYIAEGRLPPSMGESLFVEAGSPLPSFDEAETDTGLNASFADRAGRMARSKEIADQLDRLSKIVVPGAETDHSEKPGEKPLTTHEKPAEKPQTVFDRLVSPAHYTGTQREKHLANSARTRREETANVAATRLLDHLLEGEEAESSEKPGKPEAPHRQPHGHSPYEDYTQLNVFERLQKTPTQAFAVKHSGSMESPLPSPTSEDSPPNAASSRREETAASTRREDSVSSTTNGYTKLNVFERLQKTTTEAFSKKSKKIKRDNQ